MTPTTLPLDESFELTKTSERAARVGARDTGFASGPATILQFTTPVRDESPVPPGYLSIDEVSASLERLPGMKEEMTEARRWAADVLYKGKPLSLRVLRMRRGLSQAQLAEAIGTKQPHIARIESGNADLRLETCRKLAAALDVDLNTLDQALTG